MKRDFLKLCLTMRKPLGAPWHTLPVSCALQFTFARPKSHRTSKGALRKGIPERHIYKPDADNLAKFVMDALNGTYYHDDSQVYSLSVLKQYGIEDSVRVDLEYG